VFVQKQLSATDSIIIILYFFGGVSISKFLYFSKEYRFVFTFSLSIPTLLIYTFFYQHNDPEFSYAYEKTCIKFCKHASINHQARGGHGTF